MTARDRDAGEASEDTRVLWPLLGLFWIGNVAVTMAQVYASQRAIGARPGFFDLLRWVLPGYIVWLVSVPLIVFVLARRFRFEHGRWRVSIPVHLVVSLVIAGATLVVDTLFALARQPDRDFSETLLGFASSWMLWIVFTYWFFLAVVLAVRHYTTANARKLQAMRLEAAVASAQVGALRMQLRPHFLFNTLNSIASLIQDEPRAARKMVAQLGDLLRASLGDDDRASWSLRQELELMRRYTDIEKLRFGDRLNVQIDCPPDTLDAQLPTLLLQPLVENAILHGIQPALAGGSVYVTAKRDGGWLCIEVNDDGAGLSPDRDGRPRERLGLSNTRERLAWEFAGEQTFTISRREPTGTRIQIRIPWSTAGSDEEAHATVR